MKTILRSRISVKWRGYADSRDIVEILFDKFLEVKEFKEIISEWRDNIIKTNYAFLGIRLTVTLYTS